MGIGNDTVICENQAVPLSSVDHDLEKNGYEGAALLNRLMAGSKEKGATATPATSPTPSAPRPASRRRHGDEDTEAQVAASYFRIFSISAAKTS